LVRSGDPSDVKRTVSTDDAPTAVGAYSQATTTGDLLFTAGQLPLTTDGELLDDEPVSTQARQCPENVAAVLAAEGPDMSDVCKVTVFLDDVAETNDTDAEFFDEDPPARSPVNVGAVPKGGAVEIEATASVE
jgi:reactive intermediate/imine deaminase